MIVVNDVSYNPCVSIIVITCTANYIPLRPPNPLPKNGEDIIKCFSLAIYPGSLCLQLCKALSAYDCNAGSPEEASSYTNPVSLA
ncbi:hypothetical protein CJ030_MR0G007444 [Morella rubra]|uniref:Uncharacterized protein n=1 Tax=Morella rubra TaxID=262757 RepID=A0A6A1UIS4_9ROSI|nr:hypothetical protein CJ030_MR0G007444 [Morella rubra]